jgi:hypothetical protein
MLSHEIKKVATLTLPLHTNYGGVMQAYALQKVIKDLGYETELINIDAHVHRSFISAGLSRIKLSFKKLCFDDVNYNKNFDDFIKKNIKYSKPLKNIKKLKNDYFQRYNAYVVGSDQVWRADYNNFLDTFYFDFVNGDQKLVSYAASFGHDKINYEMDSQKRCSHLLKSFSAISVRELTVVDDFNSKFKIKPEVVLDPTFLLEKKEYLRLIKQGSLVGNHENGIFSYLLDEHQSKKDLVIKVSKHFDLKAHFFNEGKLIKEKESVYNWLNGFSKNKFIITDSFHGVALSIIFNKNFIAIGNKERGLGRFLSILKLFNLEDRLITDKNADIYSILNKKIDYKKVNEILNANKKYSLEFLMKGLG